jgi:hypothetical protein
LHRFHDGTRRAARLTPALDQRTIGSDHPQIHLVINIV